MPTWYAACCVQNVNFCFLVDTGASVTVLDSHHFVNMLHGSAEQLDKSSARLRGATGACLNVMGEKVMEVQLGDERIQIPVMVADIGIPGILGMNVLQALGVTIDLAIGELRIGDGTVILSRKPEQGPIPLETLCDEDLIPWSEQWITLKAETSPLAPLPRMGVVGELLEMDGALVIVTHALVQPDHGKVTVLVTNFSDELRVVPQGTVLATLSPVQHYQTLARLERAERDDPEPSLPDHLRPLLDNVHEDLTDSEFDDLCDLLIRYQDVFLQPNGPLGRTDLVKHPINTGDHLPIKQPLRRAPYVQQKLIEDEVDKMMEAGVIEPSESPWSSPVVLVRKKDGSQRFCVDYRKLNNVTRRDAYPLPRIDESFDTLAGTKYFTTLDLASGYWQVEMEEADKPKTAFSTRSGLYQFRVMPFGLSTAPATFERLMEIVMRGVQWKRCLVYLDDVICIGRTAGEALENLACVLERLRRAGLKLKPGKCELFRKQVNFLGHVVSERGIECDPSKIEALREWKAPTTLTELRAYLGFVGYYRKFIPSFATVAEPLNDLLRKDVEFRWTTRCQEAFDQLKEPLLKAPLLIYPDMEEDFILDTDASGFGIGGVLSQRRDGAERVVAYASRALRDTQRRYCTTKRELLAVVSMVHHFRHYLWGRRFLLRTDHASLKWLMNFRDAEGMVARWAARIAAYDFTCEVRPGDKHGNADGMSRCRQCKREGCPAMSPEEFDVDDEFIPPASGEDWSEFVRPVQTFWEDDPFCQDGRSWVPAWEWPESSPDFVRVLDVQHDIWPHGLNTEELREAQLADPDIGHVLRWRETSDNQPLWRDIRTKSEAVKTMWQQWKRLNVREGLLYRSDTVPEEAEPRQQLVLPLCYRSDVLKSVHNQRFGGHQGVTRTILKIKSRLYWPGITKDVQRWCAQCEKCTARKPRVGPRRQPMGSLPVGDRLERVAMDILEVGIESRKGNRYVLVVTDCFTRWTEAYAIPDHTALTVADVFVTEFVCRWGPPLKIHTDRGREFESALFRELTTLLGGEKTRTCPYHPQSDGMVERFNRSLLNMLSAVVNEEQDDWDDWIPYVLAAYRASVHESTGCTPNRLMLGRESRLPVDLMFPHPAGTPNVPQCPQEYVEWVRAASQRACEYARERAAAALVRQKRTHDLKAAERKFPVGTWVLYWYPPKARPKLGLGWTGPYLVVKSHLGWMVTIQQAPDKPEREVHIDHLKKCPYEVTRAPWVHNGNTDVAQSESDADDEADDEDDDEASSRQEPPPDVATMPSRRPQRDRKPPTRLGDWIQ